MGSGVARGGTGRGRMPEITPAEYGILRGAAVRACRRLGWRADDDVIQECMLRACRVGIRRVVEFGGLRSVLFHWAVVDVARSRTRGFVRAPELRSRGGRRPRGGRRIRPVFSLATWDADGEEVLPLSPGGSPLEIAACDDECRAILSAARGALGRTGIRVLDLVVAGRTWCEAGWVAGFCGKTGWGHGRRARAAVRAYLEARG